MTTTTNRIDIYKFTNTKNLGGLANYIIKEKYNVVKIEWNRLRKEFPELNKWTFKVQTSLKVNSLGYCAYNEKCIYLHIRHLFYDCEEECIDTMKHETEHILAGYEENHGKEWKAKCKLTGARPDYCGQSDVQKPYILRCECGGFKRHYIRKSKNFIGAKYSGNKCTCDGILKMTDNINFVF